MGRRYPSLFSYGLFSHDGPTEEMMAQTRFSMTFVARGFKSGAPVQASDKPDMQVQAATPSHAHNIRKGIRVHQPAAI